MRFKKAVSVTVTDGLSHRKLYEWVRILKNGDEVKKSRKGKVKTE